MIEKNRSGQKTGLYSVCSANELVLRAVIRHAVTRNYPLIIESTSNQVNQFGGYTGVRPHEFVAQVQKIAGEEKMPAGRYKKIYAKEPKPPYKRLLESVDMSEQCKDELRRRAALLNPIDLKRKMDNARERLFKLIIIESVIPSEKVS